MKIILIQQFGKRGAARLDRIEQRLANLEKKGTDLMDKIQEFAAQEQANDDKLDAALNAIASELKTQNDTIQQLKDSLGQISPESQVLLTAVLARSAGLVEKANAIQNPPPAAAQPS